MEVGPGMIAVAVTATVAVNQIINTLRDVLEKRFRAGKHTAEDQGAVNLLSARLHGDIGMIKLRLGNLERDVARLTESSEAISRSMRVIATALGVKLGEFKSGPPVVF